MSYLHRGFLTACSNRFQYYTLAMLMELMVILVLANVSLVVSQNVTSFHFQTFNATDTDLSAFLIQGDAALMPNASSVWLNLNSHGNSTCGSLLYANRVQFRHWSPTFAVPAVASFQTSFTFAISGQNSGGFAFMLSPTNSTCGSGGGGSMCLMKRPQNGDPSNHILAVEFDTWKNPEFGDPSTNHVGVDVNSMNSTATFNFCGDGVEKCDYFVTERDFTAWVDYDAEQRTLEVRVAVGDDVVKPEQAIIHIAELDISEVAKDYMWVGFSGSQSLYQEINKIKAWRFATGPFRVGDTNHAHVLIPKIVAMVLGIAAACAALIAVAVVVHRVLHGKWGCISCHYTDVRVMPTKRDTSDGIGRA